MRDAMKTTGLLTVILIVAIALVPLCAGEAGGLYGCANAAEEKTTVSAMDEGAVSESTASEENPSPDAGSANTENTLSSKSAAGAGATLGAVGSLTVYLYGHDDIKAKWSSVNGAAGYRV